MLSKFSSTDTGYLENSRREAPISYPTLPLPRNHQNSGIYVQLCMGDDNDVFLIVPLVFTRLLLDNMYHLLELLSDWLMMQLNFFFVCLMFWFHVLLQQFDTGNRWIWTRIDFYPCITSELVNQVNRLTFIDLSKALSFLKTGVIFPCFRLPGKIPIS